MNVLIVFAHPEPKSFNGQMLATAREHLEGLGHHVQVSDLFQQRFESHALARDFSNYPSDFFDLQTAQQQAQMAGAMPDDVKKEQERLRWADFIIFQFPLWWYNVPAPLKGYFDRVFSVGFAYGGISALAGKRVLISTSTGTPEMAWTPERKGTMDQVLFPIVHGTFALLGVKVEKAFVVYGAKRLNAPEKGRVFRQFKSRLSEILSS